MCAIEITVRKMYLRWVAAKVGTAGFWEGVRDYFRTEVDLEFENSELGGGKVPAPEIVGKLNEMLASVNKKLRLE